MKNILIVLMICIGMMPFTMSASTPTLDTKQKTTIVKPVLVYTIVENVLSNDVTGAIEYTAIQNPEVHVYSKTDNSRTNTLAIITDVGWNSPGVISYSNKYREKLNTNYLFNHAFHLSKLGVKRNWGNC